MKFPSEAIARWGTVLLLGIQLYFLIHVTATTIPQEAQARVAWIPLYESTLPQMIFVITVLVLAPVTSYAVSRIGAGSGERFWDATLMATSVVISISLGLKTVQEFGEHFRGPVPRALMRTAAWITLKRKATQTK